MLGPGRLLVAQKLNTEIITDAALPVGVHAVSLATRMSPFVGGIFEKGNLFNVDYTLLGNSL